MPDFTIASGTLTLNGTPYWVFASNGQSLASLASALAAVVDAAPEFAAAAEGASVVISSASSFTVATSFTPGTPYSMASTSFSATAATALLSGTHPLSHYLPAFAVTVAVGGAALAAAALRLRVREI